MATLHLRTEGDPRLVAGTVLRELSGVDPDMAVWDLKTMDEHLQGSTFTTRMVTSLIGVFGMLALVLSVVGVHGVVAYSVSHRTQEFGVRIALGAGSLGIVRMVLKDGLRMILIGIGFGLTLAVVATRILASLLYGVSPLDSVTFMVVSMVLAIVALAACYVPARRAASVEPSQALRYE
jgi:ABC-type antimicrobial peptide transport system permease subunit